MNDEEYLEAEYIADTLATYVEAIIHREHNYDGYEEAKKDMIKVIAELKGFDTKCTT